MASPFREAFSFQPNNSLKLFPIDSDCFGVKPAKKREKNRREKFLNVSASGLSDEKEFLFHEEIQLRIEKEKHSGGKIAVK